MSTPRGSFVSDPSAVGWLFTGISALMVVQLCLWVTYQLTRLYSSRAFQRQIQQHKQLPRGELQRIAAELRQDGSSGGTKRPRASDEACVICFSRPAVRPIDLLPCGHSCFCAKCILELWKYSDGDGAIGRGGSAGSVFRHHTPLICPLCRRTVLFVYPNGLEQGLYTAEKATYDNDLSETNDRSHEHPKESSQSMELTFTSEEEDVVLALRYNNDFLAQHNHEYVMDRVNWWEKTLYGCIRWMGLIIHAKLLPLFVGLRIVLLHVTVILYFILPSDQLVHITKLPYPSASPASTGDTAGKLHTPTILQENNSLGDQNLFNNATMHTQMNFKLVSVLEFPLLWLIYYADEILFVLSCWISIGHISNRILFWHTNLT